MMQDTFWSVLGLSMNATLFCNGLVLLVSYMLELVHHLMYFTDCGTVFCVLFNKLFYLLQKNLGGSAGTVQTLISSWTSLFKRSRSLDAHVRKCFFFSSGSYYQIVEIPSSITLMQMKEPFIQPTG